ncbi:hypothetical protein ONS96_013399 [Cadophora gregata f. sp. sojae]|nr:hypothetical protein ONS96_013399 [Cadophora gregata f. sp. sojae]
MEDNRGEKMSLVALKGTIAVCFVATLHLAYRIPEQAGRSEPLNQSLGALSLSSPGLEVTPSPPHTPTKPLAGVDGTVTEIRTEGRAGRAVEPQAAAEIPLSEVDRIEDGDCTAMVHLCLGLLGRYDREVANQENTLAKCSDHLQLIEKISQKVNAQLDRLKRVEEAAREYSGVHIDVFIGEVAEVRSELIGFADGLVSLKTRISMLKSSIASDLASTMESQK